MQSIAMTETRIIHESPESAQARKDNERNAQIYMGHRSVVESIEVDKWQVVMERVKFTLAEWEVVSEVVSSMRGERSRSFLHKSYDSARMVFSRKEAAETFVKKCALLLKYKATENLKEALDVNGVITVEAVL